MKVFLLFFIYSLLANMSYPQNNNLTYPKIQIHKPNKYLNTKTYFPSQAIVDTNLTYTYTYDNKGNQLTQLIRVFSNNSWVNNNRNTYI